MPRPFTRSARPTRRPGRSRRPCAGRDWEPLDLDGRAPLNDDGVCTRWLRWRRWRGKRELRLGHRDLSGADGCPVGSHHDVREGRRDRGILHERNRWAHAERRDWTRNPNWHPDAPMPRHGGHARAAEPPAMTHPWSAARLDRQRNEHDHGDGRKSRQGNTPSHRQTSSLTRCRPIEAYSRRLCSATRAGRGAPSCESRAVWPRRLGCPRPTFAGPRSSVEGCGGASGCPWS